MNLNLNMKFSLTYLDGIMAVWLYTFYKRLFHYKHMWKHLLVE